MGRGRTCGVSVLVSPSSRTFRPDCGDAASASSRPVPFKVDIAPRFPEAVGLLDGEREFRVR